MLYAVENISVSCFVGFLIFMEQLCLQRNNQQVLYNGDGNLNSSLTTSYLDLSPRCCVMTTGKAKKHYACFGFLRAILCAL